MQSLILHYTFLINWHHFIEICFHFDTRGFFVIWQIILTMTQGGEYFL